jgi:hypothetical protein
LSLVLDRNTLFETCGALRFTNRCAAHGQRHERVLWAVPNLSRRRAVNIGGASRHTRRSWPVTKA